MRMIRVVAPLLAPMVVLALGATTAQADPDPRLTVSAARIIRTTPVAVSSLNTVPVTVEVDAKYLEPKADPDTTLFVILQRTGGTGHLDYLISTRLTRYEGTTQNGKWRGIVNVPSTANGRFTPTGVRIGSYFPSGESGGEIEAPVPNPPELTVVGTNQPKMTARVLPDPVPFGQGFSIHWSVINGATGKPYGTRLKVWVANDNGCVESFGGPLYLTDTNGNLTKSYPASTTGGNCLMLPGSPSPNGWVYATIYRPGIVSATPAKTSAPVGTIVPVNGTVAGAPQTCPVNLQRLYGATAWRTVGTAKVRQSGRFTVNAQPAYKGYIPYRVAFPACTNYRAGVSKTFTIRGI